jgi:hypothetical protein
VRRQPVFPALAGALLTAALWLGAACGQEPATEAPSPEAPAAGAPHAACPPAALPPVAHWAQPSITPAYVGGGCPHNRGGEPRCATEGTWGWDWSGWCLHRKVDLLWWHGRRCQGGVGAYRSEGPEPLRRLHEAAEEHH